jgi:hypothetical protein
MPELRAQSFGTQSYLRSRRFFARYDTRKNQCAARIKGAALVEEDAAGASNKTFDKAVAYQSPAVD